MSFKWRSTNCFMSHNRNSKTWSIILTKEHRLKILENKVFRKVSGNDDREVKGGWRYMHYEQLPWFVFSPNLITMINSRRMRSVENVAHTGEQKIAYKVVDWKPDAKRTHGRSRRRWQDNTKMHLKESEGRVWNGCILLRIRTSDVLL